MKKPYRTQKRMYEYQVTYQIIGELNRYKFNCQIEFETCLRNKNYSEAKGRIKSMINLTRELKKYEKDDWDIDYCGDDRNIENGVLAEPKCECLGQGRKIVDIIFSGKY